MNNSIYAKFQKSIEGLNQEVLAKVSSLIKEKKSLAEISRETQISLFDLGAYFEAVFGLEDLNPNIYMSETVYERLQTIIGQYDYPSLTIIRNEYHALYNEFLDWTVLRIAKGVFYRNSEKQKSWQKKQIKQAQEEFLQKEQHLKPVEDNTPVKIDIETIPEFKSEIDAFRTERWKNFGYKVFEKIVPTQFFVMPASMSKRVHSISEHSMGKVNMEAMPYKIERLGGKAFHTIRVVEFLKKILDTDDSKVVSRNGVSYIYGNDYTDEEKDIQILATLCHDIYSGGEGEIFDISRKSLDVNHPYYHEKIFVKPEDIPQNEWDLFIAAIRNHMWKWSPQKPVTFEEYLKNGKAREYRVIKNVELSDYFAAQQNKNIETKVQTVIELVAYRKEAISEPEVEKIRNDINALGITEEDIKNTFGHTDIYEIIESLGVSVQNQILI